MIIYVSRDNLSQIHQILGCLVKYSISKNHRKNPIISNEKTKKCCLSSVNTDQSLGYSVFFFKGLRQ